MRLLFPARKFIDESIWKFDSNHFNVDEKVKEIVEAMMNDKEWKKKGWKNQIIII